MLTKELLKGLARRYAPQYIKKIYRRFFDPKGVVYDAWLNWSFEGPCNLSCEYCFSGHSPKDTEKLGRVSSSPQNQHKMPNINIPALIKTLDKTGKIFKINFGGGGEPFLVPNIVEACEQITKRHYISFNTNLTHRKVKHFCRKINPRKVLFVLASLHIKELERLGLTDTYISNFLSCKEQGIKVLARVVAYPDLCGEVDKYKNFFQNQGIEIQFMRYLGFFNGKQYPAAYTEEELRVFGLGNAPDIAINRTPARLCNAGYNAAKVSTNGDIARCFNIPESLGNIYKKIEFKKEIINCTEKCCVCPLNVYDNMLFEKAVKETLAHFKN